MYQLLEIIDDKENITIPIDIINKYYKSHFSISCHDYELFRTIKQYYYKNIIDKYILIIEFINNEIKFVSLYGYDSNKNLYYLYISNNTLNILPINKQIRELYQYYLFLYDNRYTVEIYLDVKLTIHNKIQFDLNKVIRANINYANQDDLIEKCDSYFYN
jgi:hypothetical protein